MVTVEIMVHHGSYKCTDVATGDNLTDVMHELRSRAPGTGYCPHPTQTGWQKVITALETEGHVEHGWARYRVL